MDESVDVKALRARFNLPAPSSSRDSESPKSPRPALGKPFSPISDTNTPSPHRLSPTVPGPSRAPPLSGLRPSPISHSGPLRTPVPPVDSNKVRQTGELLQNLMLGHQRPAGPRLSPVLPPAQTPISPHAFAAHAPIRQQAGPSMGTPLRPKPKQRSSDDVAPLRRALPPYAPMPPKPKRPARVNLEPYKRFTKGAQPSGATTPAAPRTNSAPPLPSGRPVSVPAAPGPPRLPQRDIKPGRLPRQTTVDMDDQEPYDDIGSLEQNDSWSDSGSLSKEEDPDEVYEYIDEDQAEQIRAVAERQVEERPEVKPSKKDMKRLQEQERREAQERQRREEQLRKNFRLKGEVEVLHTASVRHDWSGGSKLDLSVRQGDRVDIIRVKNNPGGKWLARSTSGNYGYISNACVDIDYDAIKRKASQIQRSERFEFGELPPPPPDPPGYNQRLTAPPPLDPPGYNQRSNGQDRVSEDEDYYDDVDANPGSGWSSLAFPPPPIELNIDPRIEKELRKKFKFEGPLKVLHTMMVDPNTVIKKTGAKDLSVTPGDILDVIQFHSKKALCRNKFGKFGYVNQSLLLPMEGEIYDDVEYPNEVYDNDNMDY